ncbi:TonB-dependent receptor [Acinetobacter cumulans]|uniref:TonB-dependent receptor n=2 Tax=Acinetobacter cumulans TaxID=2136182 RepID=A0A3A8G3A6_9GAMM|nr:TonB-dependent receptor [Acinetobacter cumulans]RKG53029.1 TonB-dependent receptor [Acinetobacter cumulans]
MELCMPFPFQPTALAAGLSALCLFNSQMSGAADSIAQPQLDTIVVTATRSAEKLENVPARISIIEPATIAQSPISQMSDLLRNDASINMVQNGGLGQVASIFVRGTESDHTLVLRDGVRLNSATSGMAPLQFLDTTDIQQIEVLKGPASVLYGSDAIGGVVQIISKTPTENTAFASTEVGEHKTYKSIIGADAAKNGYYAQIRGQRLESDATKVFDLDELSTASYDQKGWSAKVGSKQENHAYSLDYSHNDGRSFYVSCSNEDKDYNCLNYSNVAQDFNNEMINLRGEVRLLPTLELHALLSQFKDELDQVTTTDFTHNKTQEAEIYSKLELTPKQTLLSGITHRKISGDIVSYGTAYQDDSRSTGYYVQHQYHQDGLNTQLGIRLEDDAKYGSHTIGQAAIRLQALPLTSVYANIGTAFKSPTLDERYNSWSGNPNLKPEESISYEIGVDQKLNHGLSTGLSLYHTKVDHLIVNGPNYTLENLNTAVYQGMETYLQWQNGGWSSKLSYHYVKAQDDEKKQDLQRRPRQNLSLTTGWSNDMYGMNATLNAKSDAVDYQARNPGYATIDMSAFWNINPNLKVFTNLQNIGDVEYKTSSYGSGLYYMNGGRLASIGVTVKY